MPIIVVLSDAIVFAAGVSSETPLYINIIASALASYVTYTAFAEN